MPAVAPLILAGTAPVSVTFSPMRKNSEETFLADRRRLLPQLFGNLKKTVKQLREADRSLTGNYRVALRLEEPVVRVVDGADATVETLILNFDIRCPGIATQVEKEHAIKLLISALQSTYVTSSINTGESDYA